MIARQCFVNEWVRAKASEIGCRKPVMLEKAIVALQLLRHLAETGLPIQFKGGTSLPIPSGACPLTWTLSPK
jgi:hypothetical protein